MLLVRNMCFLLSNVKMFAPKKKSVIVLDLAARVRWTLRNCCTFYFIFLLHVFSHVTRGGGGSNTVTRNTCVYKTKIESKEGVGSGMEA